MGKGECGPSSLGRAAGGRREGSAGALRRGNRLRLFKFGAALETALCVELEAAPAVRPQALPPSARAKHGRAPGQVLCAHRRRQGFEALPAAAAPHWAGAEHCAGAPEPGHESHARVAHGCRCMRAAAPARRGAVRRGAAEARGATGAGRSSRSCAISAGRCAISVGCYAISAGHRAITAGSRAFTAATSRQSGCRAAAAWCRR